MKSCLKLLFAAVFLLISTAAGAAPERFAVAVSAAPVLNNPDFPRFFSGKIVLDPCKGVRPIEFIALPDTLFRIEDELDVSGVKVLRVTTNDYPYRSDNGFYVDARFVRTVQADAARERRRVLPPLDVIRQRLLSAVGKPYVWGGNVKEGVPLFARYYPAADRLAGVDCSGLLYEATDGYTPRNTSTLTGYGKAVHVAGLSAKQIASELQPLDLVVWKGHVMIALDRDTIIESTMGCSGGGGVHTIGAVEALTRLIKTRQPVDDYAAAAHKGKAFVVRRWLPR